MKTGDRVVCIDDSGNHCTNLKKGKEYIIHGVIKSKCCGVELIDIGLFVHTTTETTRCKECNRTFITVDPEFLRSKRFRKVEEKVNYVKLEIEVEEPCLN